MPASPSASGIGTGMNSGASRHRPGRQREFPAGLALTADKTAIQGTDGRDDVHVLVTVQDADGKPISNSPPVTFTIASGPGEFPTGRTIAFDEATDIPIRDGQAAIEFRSYYGGETFIRATSPVCRKPF